MAFLNEQKVKKKSKYLENVFFIILKGCSVAKNPSQAWKCAFKKINIRLINKEDTVLVGRAPFAGESFDSLFTVF